MSGRDSLFPDDETRDRLRLAAGALMQLRSIALDPQIPDGLALEMLAVCRIALSALRDVGVLDWSGPRPLDEFHLIAAQLERERLIAEMEAEE